MEKTDIRRGFGDDLAIQLQHEPQNAVRSWMRRPHVEHHLLTDLVLPRLAQCRVGRGHPRNRDRRFHLARRGCPGRRSYNVPARIYAGEWNFVPQAISGERTLAACWRWHFAIANFWYRWPEVNSANNKESSLRQNAATSTPQACATQKFRSRSGAEHD